LRHLQVDGRGGVRRFSFGRFPSYTSRLFESRAIPPLFFVDSSPFWKNRRCSPRIRERDTVSSSQHLTLDLPTSRRHALFLLFPPCPHEHRTPLAVKPRSSRFPKLFFPLGPFANWGIAPYLMILLTPSPSNRPRWTPLPSRDPPPTNPCNPSRSTFFFFSSCSVLLWG